MSNLLDTGAKASKGRKEYEKFMQGEVLTLKQSVICNCYICVGGYADGKEDCANNDCPLYPYMPYGEIWKNRTKKTISEERKAAFEKIRRKHV